VQISSDGFLRQILINNCSLGVGEGPKIFQPRDADGTYEKDLGEPYDRAVVHHLLMMNGRFSGVKLNGRPYTIPNEPAELAFFHLPAEGTLTFSFKATAQEELLADRDFNAILLAAKSTGEFDPHNFVSVISMAAHDTDFLTSQIETIFEHLMPEKTLMVKLTIEIFTSIFDFENVGRLLTNHFTQAEFHYIESSIGRLFYFNPTFPTGHYNLRCSHRCDLALLLKLMRLNTRSKTARTAARAADLSQWGNYSCFRNLLRNGKPIPQKDLKPSDLDEVSTFDFDFVFPNKEPVHCFEVPQTFVKDVIAKGVVTLMQEKFECVDNHALGSSRFTAAQVALMVASIKESYHVKPWEVVYESEEFKTKSNEVERYSFASLCQLQNASGVQVRPSELVEGCILLHPVFGRGRLRKIEDAELSRLEETRKVARMRCVFAMHVWDRIIDPENFSAVLSAMDPPTTLQRVKWDDIELKHVEDFSRLQAEFKGQHQLIRMLGCLVAYNVVHAEGFYCLDLRFHDDRVLCNILIKLAVIEPGENWLGESFNARSFELPASWTREIPTAGIVTLTYHVLPIDVDVRARSRLNQELLAGIPYLEMQHFQVLKAGPRHRQSLSILAMAAASSQKGKVASDIAPSILAPGGRNARQRRGGDAMVTMHDILGHQQAIAEEEHLAQFADATTCAASARPSSTYSTAFQW
jgi:hypothetical protein